MSKTAKVEKTIPEILYCPQCGLRLEKSEKWKPDYDVGTWDYRICLGQHLWDISKAVVGRGISFELMKFSTCGCGEVVPERYMKEWEKSKLCPKCFQKEEDAWQMDSKESFARMDITPVQTLEGLCYQINTAIEIKPYLIQSFEDQTAGLKKRGMVRVEVVRHDQETATTQPKLVEVKKETARVKETGKVEPEKPVKTEAKQQGQLALM